MDILVGILLGVVAILVILSLIFAGVLLDLYWTIERLDRRFALFLPSKLSNPIEVAES